MYHNSHSLQEIKRRTRRHWSRLLWDADAKAGECSVIAARRRHRRCQRRRRVRVLARVWRVKSVLRRRSVSVKTLRGRAVR
jgi:hypothetical protein